MKLEMRKLIYAAACLELTLTLAFITLPLWRAIHAGGDTSPKARLTSQARLFFTNANFYNMDGQERFLATDSNRLPKAMAKHYPNLPGVRFQLANNIVGKTYDQIKYGDPMVVATGPDVQQVYGTGLKIYRFP